MTRVVPTADAPARLLVDIRRLLDEAFAGDFSDEDWEHAIGGWHVVVEEDDVVIAHAAAVLRVVEVAGRPLRTGYVEAVATDPGRQGAGLGSMAMAKLAEVVRREFEMGALSTGEHGFYERLGWERWRGPTYVRHGSGMTRTEDEDDGVMVLRFGPSRNIDLTASISVEERRGDDW